MNHPFDYSDLHIDVLKEIGNIGAGHAATSLSQIVGRTVHMSTPVARVVSFDEMMGIAGGKEQVQAAILTEMQGDLKGSMFFVIDPAEADQLTRLMTKNEEESLEDFDSLATSAFLELGNILTGSYIRALSDFTGLHIHQTVPAVAIDMVGAMLTQGLVEISQVSDHAIMIETVFTDALYHDQKLQGHFILLPEPAAFRKIFKSLGVDQDE